MRNAIDIQNKYQPLIYNYFIRYDADYFIGYNFLYRSILRIPDEAYPDVEKFLNNLSPLSDTYSDDLNNKTTITCSMV